VNGSTRRRWKIALGLLLGMVIGGLCRLLEIPSPAPSVLTGALLVVAMTSGYAATDRWLVRQKAAHREQCGGPDGSTKSR
jgi:XapX domain-containing protein